MFRFGFRTEWKYFLSCLLLQFPRLDLIVCSCCRPYGIRDIEYIYAAVSALTPAVFLPCSSPTSHTQNMQHVNFDLPPAIPAQAAVVPQPSRPCRKDAHPWAAPAMLRGPWCQNLLLMLQCGPSPRNIPPAKAFINFWARWKVFNSQILLHSKNKISI